MNTLIIRVNDTPHVVAIDEARAIWEELSQSFAPRRKLVRPPVGGE